MGSRLRFGYTAQMVFVCFFICLLLFLLLHSEHLSFCYKQIKIKIKKERGEKRCWEKQRHLEMCAEQCGDACLSLPEA